MKSSRFRWLKLALLCGSASIAVYGSASCSHDHAGVGGQVNSDIADVIFEGETTDEALEALLAATPLASPPKFAEIVQPMDGAELPASAVPTFSWEMKSATASGPSLLSPPARFASLDRLGGELAAAPKEHHHPLLGPLFELLGPERAASAHGAPVNGIAHFLVFSTAKNDKLLRVFTAKTTYTPDAAAWKKLTSAGEPISAWVLTGVFDNNDVASDGGPFKGPWIGFTIKP